MKYSNRQIEFVLENYLLLANGRMPMNIDIEFKHRKGGGGLLEACACRKADVDRAISALAPVRDAWYQIAPDPRLSVIISRLHELAPRQRKLISYYATWHWGYNEGKIEEGEPLSPPYIRGIISTMRRWLNG